MIVKPTTAEAQRITELICFAAEARICNGYECKIGQESVSEMRDSLPNLSLQRIFHSLEESVSGQHLLSTYK